MKTALVIGFFYLNKESTGSNRINGLVKRMEPLGWTPIVLTSGSGNSVGRPERIIEVPFVDLRDAWKRRLGLDSGSTMRQQLGMSNETKKDGKSGMDIMLKAWEEVFAYPDLMKLWCEPAIEAGREILRKNKVDIIFSTSPPVTVNLIASKLSSEFNIPWIADFRDLWTQNPYYPYHGIRRRRERRLEILTLSQASALVTVSPTLAEELNKTYCDLRIESIENGFDPALKAPSQRELSKKFLIVHAGQLYWGKRDPAPVFEAIRSLIDEKKMDPAKVNLQFYGFDEGWLDGEIGRYGLKEIVTNHGIIPRDRIIALEREAQILLLLTWNDPREKGVYTGKLFEYLAARRPILATGMHGSVVETLLAKTKSGDFASTVDEIKSSLEQAYREFSSKGKVEFRGVDSEIDLYDHDGMARKFVALFDSVSSKGEDRK